MRAKPILLFVCIFFTTFYAATGQRLQSPILLLYSTDEFGAYTSEILKTEGFSDFDARELGSVNLSAELLKKYRIVVLSCTRLSPEQVLAVASYVKEAGNLIAVTPHPELEEVLGIRVESGKSDFSIMSIDSVTSIGRGLTGQKFRIHAPGSLCTAKSAETLAWFYPERKHMQGSPAVTINQFGKGRTIAFLYNLPQNVVYTRQGNPNSADKEMDGITGIRAMDLFTDQWVDGSDNVLNHADEQMRLLTHGIEWMSNASSPLPRLWYFPDTLKCIVTLNNDGEDSREDEFVKQFEDVYAKGAKMTLYIKETHLVSKAFTDKWQQRGFEISGHPDHTKEATAPRYSTMDSIYKELNQRLNKSYGIEGMKTVTNHWFVWCGKHPDGRYDFAAQAKLEELNGVGLDCNYAHYDNGSPQGHFLGTSGWNQGNYTGSGLAMKFSDAEGNLINVYQQLNNVYDQQYMEQKDQEGYFNCYKGLMDRSLSQGVYSYISVRAHNNEYFFSEVPLMQMLDYANSRNVPVWTELKLLEFLRSREAAKIGGTSWNKNVLSFNFSTPVQTNEKLSCIVPYHIQGKRIKGVSVNGKQVAMHNEMIKGYEYVFVSVKPGSSYRVAVEYAE